jgi:outer membrane lipoprotein-sorting protein
MMKTQRQKWPQMKIRWTRIKRPHFHLRASDLYLWLTCCSLLFLLAAAPSTQPALSQKSSVNEILDALDARGKDLQDFSADVALSVTDNGSGDTTTHTGTVVLQRKGPDDARIRVAFTKSQTGNLIKTEDHQYVLDNGVLDERDYLSAKETSQHVLKPGEKLDLFKLGDGPFPLPLGQKREDVLGNFDVQKLAPAAADPPNCVHLQLTPKDGTQLAKDFKTIDVWVDVANNMPRRIQTVDDTQSTTRTTDITNVKINSGIGDKDFVLPPMPPNSDIVDEPFGQQ